MGTVLHIGTHRTGTSSIQAALRDRMPATRFAVGSLLPDQHVELLFASMRPDRLAEFRPFYDWALQQTGHVIESCLDLRWGQVARTLTDTPRPGLFSCEGLSLLRYPDEVKRCARLLDGPVSLVMFTRAPDEFLASYRWALGWMGLAPSDDPDSCAYLKPDSWLVDYQARIDLWSTVATVHAIDYAGDSVRAFFELLGLAAPAKSYVLNAR